MTKALVKEGKFHVNSDKELKRFVDSQFERFDVNQDQSLSFEEFLGFFEAWLDHNARNLVDKHKKNETEVERIFMKFDKDHNFQLTEEELRQLVVSNHPPGLSQPAGAAAEIDALVGKVIKEFDTENDSELSFEEFAACYNTLMDGINAMHASWRDAVIEQTGFRQMLKRWDSRDELFASIEGRFSGPVWVVCMHEVQEVARRAATNSKIPLFLDEPPGELDVASTILKDSGAMVVEIQELAMRYAESTKSAKEVCEEIRDAVLDCMREGRRLVLRHGHSTPDWMLNWNLKGVLPITFIDPACAEPGDMAADLQEILPPNDCDFKVAEGYQLIVSSCFTMNTYKTYFRAKLPLQNLQPVQVMGSYEKVAAVLKDGLEIDEMDEKLDMISQLADAL